MLSHHIEKRGTLSYMELSELGFEPKRMYYITGVPQGEVRGNHGHRTDLQYLICVKGQIRVTLTSKDEAETTMLNAGDMVFMDKMVWGEQEYMTGEDILLVLCSTSYDKSDYITDINEILGA
tara:strand:+ start:99 stop:464 length:366 start_codon:yes stop_codon:yes gene_type:complete